MLCFSKDGNYSHTGPRSVAVSASDCGSEGLGFESHQSHAQCFSPGRLLPRYGSARGPVGKAATTQPSFMHFTDASLRVLLQLRHQRCGCRCSRAWLTPGQQAWPAVLSSSLKPKWTSIASSVVPILIGNCIEKKERKKVSASVALHAMLS